MKKLLVAVVVACAFAAFANEWYVDADNGNDLWDGTSSNHVGEAESTVGPRKTLKGAMEIPTLAANDTVWLLPGNYNEGVMPYFDETPKLAMVYASTNRCFITKPGLKIRSTGGKAVTFVTGEKDLVESTFSKTYGGIRCFLIAAEAPGVVIEGLTIQTGYAPYKQVVPYSYGGGVLDQSKSCWVIDCTITGGRSSRGGGQAFGNALRTEYVGTAAEARASAAQDVTMLVNCAIRNSNSAAPVDGGKPTLVNCLITASGSKYGISQDAAITAYNSIFVGNVNGDGASLASTFSNCVVGPYANKNVTCVSCVTNATAAEVAWASASNPYNWRTKSTSVARGVGDAAILATIQVPAGYSAYADLYGTPIPAEGKIAAGPVQPVNWYVDAVSGDDDDHGGKTQTDAFKTIRRATSVACYGDTVHVAPGTYGAAEGSELQANAQTRVVVPQGVRLQADGASGSTVICGAAATEGDAYGNGTDAVRCVYLSKDATIANFTLTDGHTTAAGNGSAVCAQNMTATVVDCLVTNNFCYQGTMYSGRNIRCRIIDNTASYRGALGYGGIYYGCFFDYSYSDGGRNLNVPLSIDFCTIGTHHTWKDTGNSPQILAPSGSGDGVALIPIRNSVLAYGRAWAANKFYLTNCVYATSYTGFAVATNCLTFASAANMKLSDDGVPSADSPVNNAGCVELAPGCIDETDLAGVPRVLNGGVDAGAFEHDWRAEYRKDLGRHATAVTAASPEVVETEDGTVRIPSGALVGTLKPGDVQLNFTVTGGTLAVYLGETLVGEFAASADPQSVKLEPTEANNEFRLAFTPTAADGYAEIARIRGLDGILLLVR